MDVNEISQTLNFVKPELLILIPVLYFTGQGINKSCIQNCRIPLILGLTGMLLAILWVFGQSSIETYQDGLKALFVAITQGILCAGCSVYADQLIKNTIKKD